jgi:hypothetical protein
MASNGFLSWVSNDVHTIKAINQRVTIKGSDSLKV